MNLLAERLIAHVSRSCAIWVVRAVTRLVYKLQPSGLEVLCVIEIERTLRGSVLLVLVLRISVTNFLNHSIKLSEEFTRGSKLSNQIQQLVSELGSYPRFRYGYSEGLGDALEASTKIEGKGVSSSKTPEQMAEIDKKAKSTIILSLADSVIREVAKETSVTGLMEKLESLYMKKSLANRLYIKKRMFTLKMTEGSSLDKHIDEFNQVCDTLATIDEALDDEGKALLLVSSLPGSYKNFVDALMYGRQALSLDEVKSALNTKELQEKRQNLDQETGEGLTAKGQHYKNQKKKQGKAKDKNKTLKCFQCHKEGHFKKDCPERKNKQYKEQRSENGDAAVVEKEGYESAGVLIASDVDHEGKWVLDSGCSFHMCPFKHHFSEYQEYDGGRVMMGNNAICRVIGIGVIKLKLHDNSILELKQVRHVPDLKRNLISLGMLDKIGCVVKVQQGIISVVKGSLVLLKGIRKNGLYVLEGTTVTRMVSVSSSSSVDKTRLWHLRLGHMSLRGLKKLSKQGLLGSDTIGEMVFCEDCVLGKSTRTSFKSSVHTTRSILDYIHSDLWGPAQVVSLGGARYFLSIIDDFSRIVWIYVLKSKEQVFEKFKNWKVLVEKQTGKTVKKLRTDNGLEFYNQVFDEFCAKEGIARHKTVRMTPQQNGLVERMNRTLMDKVRCMMIQAKLPKNLWAEILNTACYLVNLSPSTAIEFKTPFELWYGKQASYKDLKVFGCLSYAHISQGKLAPRALKCVFIGYLEGTKGYKLWCTDLSPLRCIVSRDVKFNEEAAVDSIQRNSVRADQVHDEHFEVESPGNLNQNDDTESAGSADDIGRQESLQEAGSTQSQVMDYQLTRDRQKRQSKAPKRYGYADLIAFALHSAHEINAEEPQNFKEAINCQYAKEWKKSMDEEMTSLYKNCTWELVKIPKNRRIVGCKWIYRIKEGMIAAEPRRFKARLVAKGYTQMEGVDFKEVFSPVVRHASIRVLMAITATQNLELEQLDVKTAFLHGNLQEEIFMSQPEGYESPDRRDYVCLLKKSFYGLKQSPRQWYLKFDEFITTHGFQRSEIDALKTLLGTAFDMKDLGSAKRIFGVDIRRNRSEGLVFLSQEKYLKKILETFDMEDSKPVQDPLAAHFKLCNLYCPKSEEERLEMANIPYAKAVGCLMYAMVLTRPDISHANFGTEEGLWGYVDSDYAGDLNRRRSLTGYLFMLNGCLINWKANLQHIVALSTTEAEFTAATEAAKEAIWLKGLITELGLK
ncbi:hypothetical protein KPL70_025781 [Citrus sinensis]|nr:hypothetical protein KPL70_025781 [Citrus sinensis]